MLDPFISYSIGSFAYKVAATKTPIVASNTFLLASSVFSDTIAQAAIKLPQEQQEVPIFNLN